MAEEIQSSAFDEAKARYADLLEQYEKNVKDKKDELNAAIEKRERVIAEKQEKLKRVSADYSGFVSEVGPVKLYRNRVEAHSDVVFLDASVEVDIAESGSVYSETQVSSSGPNIKGAVVGGLIAGDAGTVVGGQSKVKTANITRDTRKLFLSVIAENGSLVAEIDQSDELDARKLAAQIKQLAKTVEQREGDSADSIETAKKELSQARGEDAEVRKLTQELEELEGNRSELDAAEAEYRKQVELLNEQKRMEKTRKEEDTRKQEVVAIKALCLAVAALMFVIVGIVSLPKAHGALAGTLLLLAADVLAVAFAMFVRDEVLNKRGEKGAENE